VAAFILHLEAAMMNVIMAINHRYTGTLFCVQRPEFGGGEIYFDDVLIRKDGLFVIDSLKGLNPENLK
jgi:hypothetical protein